MKKVSENGMPKIAYVFGDLSGGGHNLQAFKTIIYSGAKDNCIVVSLFEDQDNSLEDKINAVGIEIIKLCLSAKTALTHGVKQLRKAVETGKCKIAHSNGLKADMLCCLAFKNTEIKHIITLHNYLKEDVYLRKGKLYSFMALQVQGFVLKRSKNVIACSKTLQKQMMRDNPRLQITAIQNGVDTNKFQHKDKNMVRKQYDIDPELVVFISTGRMSPRKRITETADAFINANMNDNYQLWFVGNGECFDEYRNKYREEKNIKFWGRRDDIINLLNAADVFVSSSETEGLPLAVLEALSTGRIVFLSDIPQHKEIYDQINDCVELYSLGNTAQLSQLFRNVKYYLESNHKVLELKNTDFDINVMGRKYADYYRSVIEG